MERHHKIAIGISILGLAQGFGSLAIALGDPPSNTVVAVALAIGAGICVLTGLLLIVLRGKQQTRSSTEPPEDSGREHAVELVLRRSPGDKRLVNQCTVIYALTQQKWTWLLPNFTVNPLARAPEVRLRFPMDFPQAPMPAPPGEYAYRWTSGIFFTRIIKEGTFTIDP